MEILLNIPTEEPAATVQHCLCQRLGVEFFAHVPDEYGDIYPYPLRSANFCPECGRCLQKEG